MPGFFFFAPVLNKERKNVGSVVHKWNTKRENMVKIGLGHSNKGLKKSINKDLYE